MAAALSRSPRRTTASLRGPNLIVALPKFILPKLIPLRYARGVGKSTTKSEALGAIRARSARAGPLEDLDRGRGRVAGLPDDGGEPGVDAPADDALRLDPEGLRRDAEAADA